MNLAKHDVFGVIAHGYYCIILLKVNLVPHDSFYAFDVIDATCLANGNCVRGKSRHKGQSGATSNSQVLPSLEGLKYEDGPVFPGSNVSDSNHFKMDVSR